MTISPGIQVKDFVQLNELVNVMPVCYCGLVVPIATSDPDFVCKETIYPLKLLYSDSHFMAPASWRITSQSVHNEES